MIDLAQLDPSVFLTAHGWIALIWLTVMEIVLGIDNIIIISILSGELQPIEVEVYDMFGKRVMSKHFETEASLFNQTLELNNELAAGIYLVQITVAGEQSVQRLNVVR